MPPKTPGELYEEQERALISEAIGETEQEIFDSAFDNAPDDNDGDTSLEEMDSDDVPDEDVEEDVEGEEPEVEEDDPYEDSQEQDTHQAPVQAYRTPPRGIPPGRLREEAEARRAAETRERELKSQLDQLQGRLDAFERTRQQPPPQQQPQLQKPDQFADPDGYENWLRGQLMQEVNNRHFNASLADAAEQHGDKFNEAFKELSGLNPADPANVALAQRIFFAPNPGREVMKWHQQQSLMRDIGSDPAAYRERMRQELLADPDFRKELISGMRQDASGNRRTNVQIPPSLNGASGGASHRGRDGGSRDSARTTRSIEREIFDSAWDD